MLRERSRSLPVGLQPLWASARRAAERGRTLPPVIKSVKILAVASTVGMFLVLIMGATVTNTGSQTGCGPSWPLCRGKFIPQMAVSTAIEFSHRAIVGVESVLIIALALAAWYLYPRRREIQVLAVTMVAFLFIQAGLGAWAVMQPQNAAALAIHFGVSLIAFASVLLVTVVLFEAAGAERLRDRPLPPRFRAYLFGTMVFTYVVVYLGAYVRHTNADDVCRGWPLCNGTRLPAFHGLVATNLIHRGGALVLTLLIVGLVLWARRFRDERPDMYRASHISFGLVVLQALSGAVVVWTRVDLFSALLHAGLVALLFGTLSYLCLHALPRYAISPEAVSRSVPAVPSVAVEGR